MPVNIRTLYWDVQKDLVKGCRETLDCYCVLRCELLSASIADALLFVNILVSGIFHRCFAQQLAVNKPCLQMVRRLLWKQTTTHSIRNNNPMFGQQPLRQFLWKSQYVYDKRGCLQLGQSYLDMISSHDLNLNFENDIISFFFKKKPKEKSKFV